MSPVVVLILVGLLSLAQAQTCLDPQCISCPNDPKVCNTCSGNVDGVDAQGFCVNCVRGFYYNSTDLRCNPCSENCYRCDSLTVCTSCDEYYGLNETTDACQKCVDHATDCVHDIVNSRFVVTGCEDDYYISADTLSCPMCPALYECDQCYTATQCLYCNEGFFVNSTDQCQACTAHCLQCVDETKTGCFTCASGYEEVGGQCVETSCSSSFCTSVGQVILPGKNGYNCGGACQPAECCGGVADGYIGYFRFDKPGATDDCADFIGVVIAEPGCVDLFVYSYNWTCQSGSFNRTDSDLFDTTCASISSFWDGASSSCIPDDPNAGGAGSSAIVLCPDSQKCEARCTACINGQCQACLPGFGLSSASQCVACESNCQTCSSASTCTDCFDGFYLNNGDCPACPTNCTRCDDASTCTDCTDGHYLNAGKCDGCSITNCAFCPNDNCLDCFSPYDYNSIADNCTRVPDHATQWTYNVAGGLLVTACENGFYVASDQSSCVPCPGLCSRCRLQLGVVQCTSCAAGTYTNSTTGLCTACNATIKYCDACVERYSPGGLYCTSCNAGMGFTKTAQKCESCVGNSNCDQCLSYQYETNKAGELCLSCPRGYSLDQDRKCIDNNNASSGNLLVPSIGVLLAILFALLF